MQSVDSPAPVKPIHTIGHSNHRLETFLGLLAGREIDAVADVRSVPWSRRWPQYRKVALADALRQTGVRYAYLGDALGGRPEAFAAIEDPVERYARIADSDAFRAGLERVIAGAARFRLALMCAERDPMRCHRALLVARHLARHGADVRHIHGDGSVEPHAAFEDRLVATAGPAAAPLFEATDSGTSPLDDAYDQMVRGGPRRR